MSDESRSVVTRLVDRVFPRMPDFYGLINEQCDTVVSGMEVFERFMESGDPQLGEQVREIEKQGDVLKARNTDVLNRAFSTPMDREDIYRAINSIDQILNYAKTTVREMEVLGIQTDAYLHEMAGLILEGAKAIQDGYGRLSKTPAESKDCEDCAQAARKAERRVEKLYRKALAELFEADECIRMLEQHEEGAEAKAMLFVIDMFKRREIYRHMSNAADQVAWAGDVLHDVIVKIS